MLCQAGGIHGKHSIWASHTLPPFHWLQLEEEEEEEEEEMRSPGRAHPLANPTVPTGPNRSQTRRSMGGDPDCGPSPAQHRGCSSPLRLLPMDP